ncbi:hypothetical protein L596_001859 [Steinernema carpocapsae]|uniref:Uncharacterized protein n=1 Tax=Steinernema carpocapsae TaxID=34508 RepID=A0A4U8UPI2_STECR|nr:hypothetical protein L596_001859 [Steinernema carpocapsae]
MNADGTNQTQITHLGNANYHLQLQPRWSRQWIRRLRTLSHQRRRNWARTGHLWRQRIQFVCHDELRRNEDRLGKQPQRRNDRTRSLHR